MKRNTFLQTCLSAGVLTLSPFVLLAKSFKKFSAAKGFKVEAGKDRFDKSISLFEGDTFYTKIATADTNGDMFVFESSRIKEGGPTYHYHFEQDEWWYVLQGKFLIKVGETTYEAKAGDSVFGPRMIPHAFAKVGEEEGKLLMVFQPAGKMEALFKKISEGAIKNMSEEEKEKLRNEHGFKSVGPALTNFKNW